jgi:hypothetical protein
MYLVFIFILKIKDASKMVAANVQRACRQAGLPPANEFNTLSSLMQTGWRKAMLAAMHVF